MYMAPGRHSRRNCGKGDNMKVSFNWIREYVELPADLTMEKLAFDLTMRTVEVEGWENLATAFKKIVAGRIVAVDPHPQADRLRVVQVDVGEFDDQGALKPAQVVCGGSNLEVDQMVILARPGSWVRWHGEGELVELKTSKLRGVMSEGMICASAEVGLENLFPSEDDHLIVDLAGVPCQPGDNMATVLHLDDQILEIDNKSMTNRPDLWGHYGIARELAAIYGCPLKPLPVFKPKADLPAYPVVIENPDLCRRYAAMVISDLVNEPSPLWLQIALFKVGLRPINNLVDITNYVMLAVGQPTHGFDRSHVKYEIRVRTARKGEVLELLDGKKLQLNGTDLLIADRETPLGLAGIMGGKNDSVLPETTEIVLEIANFAPRSLRRTTQAFGLRTEASSRFEKHVDTQRVDQGLGLAAKLFAELIPGARITAFSDVCPQPTQPPVIEVTLSFLSKRLGSPVTAADVTKSLAPLGFTVEADGDLLKVATPSWRGTGDVTLPDDILEEVARMIGYANFAYHAPAIMLEKPINQRGRQLDRSLREYLAFRCGFQEVFTYPWIEDRYHEAAGLELADLLAISTPPSPDNSRLRSSLVPAMLETLATNLRYFDAFRVFEQTQVFRQGTMSPSIPQEVLPLQERRLAGALAGNDAAQLFFEAKGIIASMGRYCQMKGVLSFERVTEPIWAEKKVWLNILLDGEVIGTVGLLSMKTMKAAGIKNAQAVVFELNVEKMEARPSRTNAFHPLPQFPLVEQDLSMLLDENVKWMDIEALVKPLVKDISYVEEYRGKQVPEGKRSLMLRVHLGSDEGTMTSEQIEEGMKRVMKKLQKQFGAEIRGV